LTRDASTSSKSGVPGTTKLPTSTWRAAMRPPHGARAGDPRSGDVAIGHRVEQLCFGHRLAIEEVLRPLVLQVGLALVGLGFGESLGQGALVDRRQHGAAGDRLAELRADRFHGATDLGRQRGPVQRREIGRQAGAIDDVVRRELHRAHLGDVLVGLAGGRLRGRLAAAGERQRAADQEERRDHGALHGCSLSEVGIQLLPGI